MARLTTLIFVGSKKAARGWPQPSPAAEVPPGPELTAESPTRKSERREALAGMGRWVSMGTEGGMSMRAPVGLWAPKCCGSNARRDVDRIGRRSKEPQQRRIDSR